MSAFILFAVAAHTRRGRSTHVSRGVPFPQIWQERNGNDLFGRVDNADGNGLIEPVGVVLAPGKAAVGRDKS